MRARPSGIWDPRSHFENSGWRKMRDFEQVSTYAERTRKSFRRWASTLTEEEENMACDGFYGPVSLSRLVEISLGYCSFRLRGVYRIMRTQLGVELEDPMDDAKLLETGVPAEGMG